MGLSGDSAGKESACHSGNLGLIPGLGRAPGSSPLVLLSGNGYPLKYSCLENSMEKRSLAGYNPWCRRESDMTKQLTLHFQKAIYPYLQEQKLIYDFISHF